VLGLVCLEKEAAEKQYVFTPSKSKYSYRTSPGSSENKIGFFLNKFKFDFQ
jgi:hypothetical protein